MWLTPTGRWLGQGRQEALEPAREAADAYRSLAEASPEAYLPPLALSLHTLAWVLGEAGQWQEALEPAREAADAYRSLAEASPDTYLPGLAELLNNLATRLTENGEEGNAAAAWESAKQARAAIRCGRISL